jgi:hypothetical protein
LEDENNREKQVWEDDRVQLAMELDVHHMFTDWNYGKIMLSNPNTVGIYYIHHDSAKWTDGKMKEFRDEYFNKLKEEALAKVDISHLDSYTEEDLKDFRVYMILERIQILALRKKLNIC